MVHFIKVYILLISLKIQKAYFLKHQFVISSICGNVFYTISANQNIRYRLHYFMLLQKYPKMLPIIILKKHES